MRLPSLLLLALALPVIAGPADGTLDLYWIDSEGGGSTLIVTPAGESVLIDSGNPGGRDSGRIHKVATEVAKLKQLDHYITTHFHRDHFGGAAELAELMPIVHVWDNGIPDADPDGNKTSTWPLTSKAYRAMTVQERHVVQPGTLMPLKAGVTPLDLRCVITRQQPWMPPVTKAAGPNSEPPLQPLDTSDNANSSAWVLGFGLFRFYDGGDLTWNCEAKLVWPTPLVAPVDIYQVTHHGLGVSNHPWLLRMLQPTVSVMNNGPTKGAAAEVITTLRSLPGLKAQYQVHKNVRPDGATNNTSDEFIANLAEKCDGNFIHCRVAADGKTYTIEIPSGGPAKTYATRAQ
jgi:beta-lactamase superfamily II metal-dependent hydrolase